jgi:hypothetical protein
MSLFAGSETGAGRGLGLTIGTSGWWWSMARGMLFAPALRRDEQIYVFDGEPPLSSNERAGEFASLCVGNNGLRDDAKFLGGLGCGEKDIHGHAFLWAGWPFL